MPRTWGLFILDFAWSLIVFSLTLAIFICEPTQATAFHCPDAPGLASPPWLWAYGLLAASCCGPLLTTSDIVLFYFLLLNYLLDHTPQSSIPGLKGVTTFMIPVTGCLVALPERSRSKQVFQPLETKRVSSAGFLWG